MRTTKVGLLIALLAALAPARANAWIYVYGYKTVLDANADSYIVAQQDVMKYNETWNTPAISYWGPTANDVASSLTYRFVFSGATTEVHLLASITSFNWTGGPGAGTGSSSLWGSLDGVNWELLLDNPVPTSAGGLILTYDQDVPASLLGGSSFWLQARMNQQGAISVSADGELSRSAADSSNNVFQINATGVPEPSVGLFCVWAAVLWGIRRKSPKFL